MKPIVALCTCAVLTASPLAAQDDGAGRSMIEDGLRLFMEGLMQEMEPALDQLEGLAQDMEPALRNFAENMGPALRDLMDEVKDWSAYHPPEVLPNGDIILRKKTPQELTPPAPPQNEVEL